MILNESLKIDGILSMTGNGGHWFKVTPKTTAQRNTQIAIEAWGVNEKGRTWFNTTTLQWEGWDGTQVVLLG